MNEDGLTLEVQVPVTYTVAMSLDVALEDYKEYYGDDLMANEPDADQLLDWVQNNMRYEDFVTKDTRLDPEIVHTSDLDVEEHWSNAPKRISGFDEDGGLVYHHVDYDFEDLE